MEIEAGWDDDDEKKAESKFASSTTPIPTTPKAAMTGQEKNKLMTILLKKAKERTNDMNPF